MKKIFLAVLVIFAFTCTATNLQQPAFAEEYSVETPHVIINQVFGGKEGTYFSHSFIELYNPTNANVDLSNYAIHYRASSAMATDTKNVGEGKTYTKNYSDNWYKVNLSGKIPSKSSYLIRCNELSGSENATYKVLTYSPRLKAGDSSINNKCLIAHVLLRLL